MARTPTSPKPRTSSRSKRDEILRVATKHFGRDGYEDSKWAAVAAEVGIGSTALYHLDEQEILRNRVLQTEMFLVGVHRSSPREEEARQRARALTRDIEFAW